MTSGVRFDKGASMASPYISVPGLPKCQRIHAVELEAEKLGRLGERKDDLQINNYD